MKKKANLKNRIAYSFIVILNVLMLLIIIAEIVINIIINAFIKVLKFIKKIPAYIRINSELITCKIERKFNSEN